MIAAFVIWSIIALAFVLIGVKTRGAAKAVGFFTGDKPPQVTDVGRYNRAVASLWFVAALLFDALGLPLLFTSQNSPLALLVVLGVPFWAIGLMAAYLHIADKYRKR